MTDPTSIWLSEQGQKLAAASRVMKNVRVFKERKRSSAVYHWLEKAEQLQEDYGLEDCIAASAAAMR
ncbi:hypothetical protein GQ54DRAFT_299185, partial [Martensiomyces pterosporus]